MAIQKMIFLRIVGSVEDMHEVLKCAVMNEKMHFDFEHAEIYDNSYIIHEFESFMAGPPDYTPEDVDEVEALCTGMEKELSILCDQLHYIPRIDQSVFSARHYSIHNARADLDDLNSRLLPQIQDINEKQGSAQRYGQLKQKMIHIKSQNLDFGHLKELNYFDYEIGSLSRESRQKLRQNYENISSVVLNIGRIKDPAEDIQIIIFPKQLKEETSRLLQSLSWEPLDIPDRFQGTVSEILAKLEVEIQKLSEKIKGLTDTLAEEMKELTREIDKIHTSIQLEKRIIRLEREIDFGETAFVMNAWIKRNDREEVRKSFESMSDRLIVEEKNANEIERQVIVPTYIKTNFFTKPFESIVRLYGIPSYNELDPTPFFAVSFCLMFGIMFGDLGQGLIYVVMGALLSKKSATASQVLTRLGACSMLFGLVYGSLFGLEKEEISWMPSLIGRPLDPENIPVILMAGVTIGVIFLTISYGMGIINAFLRKDIGVGIFSNTGISGYVFYISLILLMVSAGGIITVPKSPLYIGLFLSMLTMMLKTPLNNFLKGRKPLLSESTGSYLTESFFEALETVLTTLSNAISFVRIGAFALNHAGLFLAFWALSEMMPNSVLKFTMLVLGNLLILSLEGLVVFIQGLRLEYDEMFSKYFQGEGIDFMPVTIYN